MGLFRKKTVLISKRSMTLGEFDVTIDGGYNNVKYFPIEAKIGRDLYISVTTDVGIDISVVDAKGMNEKYKGGFIGGVIGPVPVKEKGTMTLIFGIYRGDKANLEFEVWME